MEDGRAVKMFRGEKQTRSCRAREKEVGPYRLVSGSPSLDRVPDGK